MRGRVVILDSSGSLLGFVGPLLERNGYGVDAARTPQDVATDGGDDPALVIVDACAPCRGGPPGIVGQLRKRCRAPILQVSGCEAVDAASRCHAVRADDFLVRPFPAGELVERVDGLTASGPQENDTVHGICAESECMRDVLRAVRMVAPTDSTVLLTGETGTGKEMLARAVHAESAVSEGPFVPVDCGALPESLLESELFGHVRGAFTGAEAGRRGLIEAAQGGTLFLDEVGSMPPRLQMLLLRVIQERKIRRLGDTDLIPVDVRIVAATRMHLAREVEAGRFREDLFYRLSVFCIDVPPLRERPGDVTRIVLRHLGVGNGDQGADVITLESRAVLEACTWPGNVRQLLSVLETARIRAGAQPIDVRHLPESVFRQCRLEGGGGGNGDTPKAEIERIRLALERAAGNRTLAGKILGVSRTTLWRRIKDLGIEAPER